MLSEYHLLKSLQKLEDPLTYIYMDIIIDFYKEICIP